MDTLKDRLYLHLIDVARKRRSSPIMPHMKARCEALLKACEEDALDMAFGDFDQNEGASFDFWMYMCDFMRDCEAEGKMTEDRLKEIIDFFKITRDQPFL